MVFMFVWFFVCLWHKWKLSIEHKICENGKKKLKGKYVFYVLLFNSLVMADSAAPWTAACQASLSFTTSWSLLKLMPIETAKPSNHLILCCPLLLCLRSFPASGKVWVGYLHQVDKVLELQLQHQSFQCIFRIDLL